MTLGMEVGLGPGDFLRGPRYHQNRGHINHLPVFGLCLLWPNDWMDEDATWYGSRPRPRPHCIKRVQALRERGTAAPHLFGLCLLWPRSPNSATAELLYKRLPKNFWWPATPDQMWWESPGRTSTDVIDGARPVDRRCYSCTARSYLLLTYVYSYIDRASR